jgi:hypothetical protein
MKGPVAAGRRRWLALQENDVNKWETSYTKRVVDDLEKVLGSISRFDTDYYAVQNAVQLLIQYHRDMHVPYEQRDEALAKAKYQLKVNTVLNKDLTRATDRIKELAAANKYLLAELARMDWNIYAGEGKSTRAAQQQQQVNNVQWRKQKFVACAHYPNALYNYFHQQTDCEWCCQNEPLKWFDNGHHREPGK